MDIDSDVHARVVDILIGEYVDGECNCLKCREKRFATRFWTVMFKKKQQPRPFIPRDLDWRIEYGERRNRRYHWTTRYSKVRNTMFELDNLHRRSWRRLANYKRFGTAFRFCRDCGIPFKTSDEGGKVNFKFDKEHRDINYFVEWVCGDCLRHYKSCPDCGFSYPKHKFVTVNFDREAQIRANRYGEYVDPSKVDRKICTYCFHKTYAECEKCSITVDINTPHFYHDTGLVSYSNNKHHMCDVCHEKHKEPCSYCSDTIYDFAYKEDSENNKMCGACFNKGIAIHDYTFKPPKVVRKGKKNPYVDDSTLLFGVELEVENLLKYSSAMTPRDAMAHKFLLLMGRDNWYLKSDSSLTDGVEVVCHPFSWQKLKEDKPDWERIFQIFGEHKWGSTKRCGIHIHMSKAAFTSLHLYKYIKFVYEESNREFMYLIAQRKGTQVESYARFYAEDQEQVAKTVKNKKNYSNHRHSAISLLYEPTVEVRIFQSTIEATHFYKNLEFCKALFEFSKNNNIENMVVYKFIMHLQKNANQYPNLLQFIADNYVDIAGNYPVVANILTERRA